MKKKQEKKELSTWDWEVLVAAWRYYEYRMTIASSSFPAELVSRYFTGEYAENEMHRIARQFVEIDHHNGISDWTENKFLMDCDKKPWCCLWDFLNSYLHGHKTIIVEWKGDRTEMTAFYCSYDKHWHEVYTNGGANFIAWIADECVIGEVEVVK